MASISFARKVCWLGAWILLTSRAGMAGVMDQGDVLDEFEAGYTLAIERLAAPFEFPSSLSLLPDGRALVTERAGRLWLVGPVGQPLQVDGVPPVLSRDHARLARLRQDLALYRLTFGQPRQEDMLELLRRRGVEADPALLARLRIDLSP